MVVFRDQPFCAWNPVYHGNVLAQMSVNFKHMVKRDAANVQDSKLRISVVEGKDSSILMVPSAQLAGLG